MTITKELEQMRDMAIEGLRLDQARQGGAAGAQASLQALLVEMQALATILPRMAMGDPVAETALWSRAARVATSEEEAVDAGFDNLPL